MYITGYRRLSYTVRLSTHGSHSRSPPRYSRTTFITRLHRPSVDKTWISLRTTTHIETTALNRHTTTITHTHRHSAHTCSTIPHSQPIPSRFRHSFLSLHLPHLKRPRKRSVIFNLPRDSSICDLSCLFDAFRRIFSRRERNASRRKIESGSRQIPHFSHPTSLMLLGSRRTIREVMGEGVGILLPPSGERYFFVPLESAGPLRNERWTVPLLR